MLRTRMFHNRPRLVLSKARNVRWVTVLSSRPTLGALSLKHSETFEPLYIILPTRSTFLTPWKRENHHWNDSAHDRALIAPDGLVYPGQKRVQLGRKRRKHTASVLVENTLNLGVKEWHFMCELNYYFEARGLFGLGRDDDSPFQPYMWETPKGIKIPPSLQLTSSRRRISDPECNTSIELGPAYPMSLECLNQNLNDFMQDSGKVTSMRDWFTPEERWCKKHGCIDFVRAGEEWDRYNPVYPMLPIYRDLAALHGVEGDLLSPELDEEEWTGRDYEG